MTPPQSDRSDTPPAGARLSLLDRLRDAGNVERLALALFPNGKREGSLLRLGNATGVAGRSLSLELTGERAGLWFDHGAGGGVGGDVVGLACEVWSYPPERIGAELERGGFIPPQLGRRSPARSGSEADESLLPPVGADPPANRIRDNGDHDPSARWVYQLGDGRDAFWVLRYDLPGGRKEIRPARWGRRRDGSPGWELKSFPAPRPLYRLPDLLARPDAPVLVVEGEKAADRAAALFPDVAVTTSAGGAAAAGKTGWGDLAGRDVYLLPDADRPDPEHLDRGLAGEHYAAEVARLALAAGASSVRRLPPTAVARALGVALPDGERGVDDSPPAPPFDAAALPYGELPAGWDVGDAPAGAGPVALDDLRKLAGDPLAAPPEPAKPTTQAGRDARRDDQWAAIELASKAQLELDYVYLANEFWRLNGGAARERVDDTVLTADIRRVLDVAGEEVRPGAGLWLGNNAVLEVKGRWRDLSVPESVRVLRPADFLRAHNLDTGELVGGVPFADCTVSVGRDGAITTRSHDAREFYSWALPYGWAGVLDAPPARFAEFLQQTFDGAEDSAERGLLLCELIGMTLAGGAATQVIPYLKGVGRSGKGTVLRLLTALLGGDDRVAGYTSPAKLAGRFALDKLVGKGAVILGDFPKTPLRGFARDEFLAGCGVLKSISGGDPVDAQAKNGATVSVRLDLVIWCSSNYLPGWVQDAEDSTSWAERLLPIRFDRGRAPAERIPNYEIDVLGGEFAEIAGYCIGRYVAALERGCVLGGGRGALFTRPASTDSLLAEIVGGADARIHEFGDRRIRRERGGWVSRRDIRAALSASLDNDATDTQAAALYEWIEGDLGAVEGGRKGVRGYKGIRLVAVDGSGDSQASLDAGGTGDSVCSECGAPGGDHDRNCSHTVNDW